MADAQLAGDGPATTEPARAGGRRVAELVAAFIIAPALLDRGGVGRLLLLTLLASPQTLFAFPRTRPVVWLFVMCLYPLSAYAQELTFRTSFFHRYGHLFARPRAQNPEQVQGAFDAGGGKTLHATRLGGLGGKTPSAVLKSGTLFAPNCAQAGMEG